MKRLLASACALVILTCVFCAPSHAHPLILEYTVEDIGGGLYDYEFLLTLDDHDKSWQPGDGWSWIIFGDKLNATSPLSDFSGDATDLPVGPFAGYSMVSGYHNGPGLLVGPDGSTIKWIPVTVGDSLFWSGTSGTLLNNNDLYWSTLNYPGSGRQVDMEVANLVDGPLQPGPEPVPEPATVTFIALGCVGVAAYMRRRTSVRKR